MPDATLQDLLARATKTVAFTGAGLSTECGVPDFRSPGSPWLVHKPIDYADFIASPQARIEAWRRKFILDDLYAGAAPGRGHQSLTRLVRQGKITGIITQNIDGLHAASGLGHDHVVELHGNGTFAICLACDAHHRLEEVRRQFEASGAAPTCACGGMVKSATISFGQAVPRAAVQRALAWSTECDLFLAVGSSLLVQPAASFPALARRNGARLVIINRDPTPLDTLADLRLRDDIGSVLGAILVDAL